MSLLRDAIDMVASEFGRAEHANEQEEPSSRNITPRGDDSSSAENDEAAPEEAETDDKWSAVLRTIRTTMPPQPSARPPLWLART
mmetsp:Transcript_60660/g.179891  ORF Transcript_60660/g.179891 Transcript_60660/m.179891 type:complete len:85 (-) Transcript_60660:203-457(-)